MYSLFLSNALFISDNGFKFTAAYLRKSLKKFQNLKIWVKKQSVIYMAVSFDKIKLVISSCRMWNLNQFNSLTFFRTFKVAERSLEVCEYVEFAKSQDDTWEVKNILMKDFDWQVKCDVVFVSMATWTIEYNLKFHFRSVNRKFAH